MNTLEHYKFVCRYRYVTAGGFHLFDKIRYALDVADRPDLRPKEFRYVNAN